ncbi:collagen binding domain-containing protein, partial [Thermoplasmatota archaeon]
MNNKKLNKNKLLILSIISVVSLITVLIPSVTSLSDPSGYDMTYPNVSIVTINDALWEPLPSTQPTGSGVFYSFLRLQANPNERGFNTDGRKLLFDELKSATFTHSFFLADVPLIEYPLDSGNFFYEFQLDINEQASDPNWFISLDEFQIWTSSDPDILNYNEGSADGSGDGFFPDGINLEQAKLAYNLDGDGPTWIKMDYRWNTGSGKRDYRVLIPDDNFDGIKLEYVILFARHGLEGGIWISDSGYEEWGVEKYPEEPDTMVTIETSAALQGDIVHCGDTIDLYIDEANTGTEPLINVQVIVNTSSTIIATLNAPPENGDVNSNDILDIGEIWSWTIYGVQVNGPTTYYVTGYGEYPDPKHPNNANKNIPVTYPDHPFERTSIFVDTRSCIYGYKTDMCDDDAPIAGAVITLTKPDTSTVTYTTLADGYYEFCDLEAGDYNVEETTIPDGYYIDGPDNYDITLICDDVQQDFANNHPLMCIYGYKTDMCDDDAPIAG